ncbi:MAG: type II toxin-antitoxin system prevent-host-death family antitoxin [Acidimicrobiia bacterium]
MTISNAGANLSELARRVIAGDEIIVTQRGVPTLKIVRADAPSDPVDRLLISQSRAEKITLVTTDPTMAEHDIEVFNATISPLTCEEISQVRYQ